jgi:YYY domain-containing protein
MSGVAATLVWLLAIEALGLLALPLTLRLFRSFPDRGWGLSKLIGWALLAYPLWLGASVGLARFTLPYLLAALVVGAIGAAGVAYRWRAALRAILRGAGPAIAASEGIFLLAGGYFLALRAANPDLWHTYWGGEKPMELAHLNAILRSTQFPPHDPWFAGGTLNYYYYGQYLVAVLVKLTGVPVEIAFNLAMPTISALVAGAAFSVAATLARFALRGRTGGLTLAFGALGTLLFVGVGNLAGVGEVVGRLRAGDRRPLPFASFWDSSRAIAGAITEFPYFTQVWADLHAHAVALPFTILAVGLVVALATDDERSGASSFPLRLTPYALRLSVLALVLGGLACTNAWDVPVYLALVGAGIFLAVWGTDSGRGGF